MRFSMIITVLCVIITSLSAIEPQINLPDVIITGDSDVKAELPVKAVDLSQFVQTDSTKFLQYEPTIAMPVLLDPTYKRNEICGFLNTLIGNRYRLSYDVMYHSLTNPLLIFSSDRFNHHWSAHWEQSLAQFQWSPDFTSFNLNCNFKSLLLKTPLSASNTDMIGGTLGFMQKPGPQGHAFLNCTDVFLTYIHSHEDSEFSTRLEDYNLYVKTMIPISGNVLAKLRYENLNQEPQEVISVYYDKIINIHRLGVWLAADRMHIYPSLDLLYIHPLGYRVDVFAGNEPYIKNDDIYLAFQSNPWQRIDVMRKNDIQEKALINTKLGFEYHAIFHFSLSHTVQYRQDTPIYFHNPSELYQRRLDNCVVQTTEFKTGWGIDKFVLENSIRYNQYRCDAAKTNWLPYAAILHESISLIFHSRLSTTKVDASIESRRRDHLGNSLAEAFILNVKQDILIYKNMIINVNLDNLLDERYILFRDVPYQPFNARIGATITF